jgi:hypothetical protein
MANPLDLAGQSLRIPPAVESSRIHPSPNAKHFTKKKAGLTTGPPFV